MVEVWSCLTSASSHSLRSLGRSKAALFRAPHANVKHHKDSDMKKILLLLAFLGGSVLASNSNAACQCVCMNGEVRAVCSSTLDIEPICPPRVCPITPPSVEPIQQPRVPPVGTSNCVQRQIYNEYTHRYEWREVCY